MQCTSHPVNHFAHLKVLIDHCVDVLVLQQAQVSMEHLKFFRFFQLLEGPALHAFDLLHEVFEQELLFLLVGRKPVHHDICNLPYHYDKMHGVIAEVLNLLTGSNEL